jgi:hypothetical protein
MQYSRSSVHAAMALAHLNGEEGDVTPTAVLVFVSDFDMNVFNGGSSL